MPERKEMMRRFSIWSLVFATFVFGPLHYSATGTCGQSEGLLATTESRRRVVYTEAGEITAVDVSNGRKDFGSYHLEFFTLDTRSLFLPVLLHADMVFYVHTGRGTISWIDKMRVEVLQVEPGDIYRLEEGTVFYIQSSRDPTREKLRIHAIFNTCGDDDESLSGPFLGGAYSNVNDMVRGFDVKVLQMGFGASVEVIEEIKRTEKPPPIIPFEGKNESESHNMEWREGIFEALLGMRTVDVLNEEEDKKAFNILKRKPDVENSHGQSIALTHKDAKALKGSSMGVFMVNLTKGSMIGPHWNPKATEIAIVIKGHGIVQVICPSNPSGLEEKNFKTKSFYVKEGDVFIIPKFYPMAQMSFKNSSFVFVGFSNNVKRNHPQFLAGKWSVIRVMNREIMAASFNVTSETFGHLLAKQEEAVLLGCEGCAEEVMKKLEKEIERKEEEEKERKWKEEERKREEEEEARRREEEKRREEEEKQRKEEARRKEEDERRREEEDEARRREEEKEAERKWEEDERREKERREKEEEAQRERERRKEEEEAQRREEEEEALRRWEEEEQRERERREEEEEARRREEEEEDDEHRKREEEEVEMGEGGGKVEWRKMWST